MVYVTTGAPPLYHQLSLEEFLFGTLSKSTLLNPNTSNTRTYEFDYISQRLLRTFDYEALLSKLRAFNLQYEGLRDADRHSLYRTFYIPKKSGGLRKIDAPNDELKVALNILKGILENDFKCLYHTAAFAYVKKRSTVKAMQRHQQNESKWFAKLDLHNFFGSTTLDFVLHQFSMIFPFSEVVKLEGGYSELERALELAFLDGGLPQGTPVSPIITNVMMIPVDFKLSKALRNFENQRFVYTRYADDFQISSKYEFDINKISELVAGTLGSFNASFSLNRAKTRYGSSAGRNWNLGLMLNKDNQITVGRKRIRHLENMLFRYLDDKRRGIVWDPTDVQKMFGCYNYCKMVEPEPIEGIIDHINRKFEADVIQSIKDDIY